MSQDIYLKVKRKKDRFHEKVGIDLRDRVRRETKDTLDFIGRQQSRGISDRKIMQDLEKSRL